MGILNLQEESAHLDNIKRALENRGLRMDPEDDWEIHGPHGPHMPEWVYVGYAYYDKWHPFKHKHIPKEHRRDGLWVAIWPRAVYEIDDAEVWNQNLAENRILLFKNKGVGVWRF